MVVAVATAGFALRRSRFAPGAAKICRVLAVLVAVLGLVAALSTVGVTLVATSAPGLDESDRSRMWQDGLSAAFTDALIAGVIAGPAFLLAHWVLRRLTKTPINGEISGSRHGGES